MGFLLILLLFVLFWAFLIRPKQREMKRHQQLVAAIEVGDEVMTGSGFYGTVTEMDTDTVRIELSPGVEVKVARRAVASKVPPVADELSPVEDHDDHDDTVDDDIVDAELVDDDEVEVIEPLEDVSPVEPGQGTVDPGTDDTDRPDGTSPR